VSVTVDRDARAFARGPTAILRPRSGLDQPAVPAGAGKHFDTATPGDRRLTVVGRTAVAMWVLVVADRTVTASLAFNRQWLLL
jgi:hypothetical protein